jgi:hypothetical protein
MKPILAIAVLACACGHPHDNGGGDVDGSNGSGDDAATPADAQVAPTGTGIWQGRGAGTDGSIVYAMATDTDGSIVAVGLFKGSVDFGLGYMASRGGQDFFVVKYTADGTASWSHQIGGCGDESYPSVAIGPDHAIYLAGVAQYVGSSCNPFFANAPISSPIPITSGGLPLVIARYEANGDETWAHAFGGANPNVTRVAVAVRGDAIAIAANTGGNLDFGNGVTVGSAGNGFYATVIAVVAASDGTARWAKPIGTVDPWLDTRSMAIDDDQIVIAGNTSGTTDVGAPQTIVGFGSGDAILAAYDLVGGGYRWNQHLGGPGDDQVSSITRAPDGSFWIAGSFTQTAHFGGAALIPTGTPYSGYAAHFAATGAPLASFVTLDNVESMNVGAAAFDDGVVVVGERTPISSDSTAFATRFDAHGTALWHDDLGGPVSAAMAVATGPHAEIVVGGTFTNTLTVPGLAMMHSSSANHSYPDAFVVRVAP